MPYTTYRDESNKRIDPSGVVCLLPGAAPQTSTVLVHHGGSFPASPRVHPKAGACFFPIVLNLPLPGRSPSCPICQRASSDGRRSEAGQQDHDRTEKVGGRACDDGLLHFRPHALVRLLHLILRVRSSGINVLGAWAFDGLALQRTGMPIHREQEVAPDRKPSSMAVSTTILRRCIRSSRLVRCVTASMVSAAIGAHRRR